MRFSSSAAGLNPPQILSALMRSAVRHFPHCCPPKTAPLSYFMRAMHGISYMWKGKLVTLKDSETVEAEACDDETGVNDIAQNMESDEP